MKVYAELTRDPDWPHNAPTAASWSAATVRSTKSRSSRVTMTRSTVCFSVRAAGDRGHDLPAGLDLADRLGRAVGHQDRVTAVKLWHPGRTNAPPMPPIAAPWAAAPDQVST